MNLVFKKELQKDGNIASLIRDNVIKENYNELERAQIMPTTKKETKYLLGTADKESRDKNPAENTIWRLCPPQADYKDRHVNRNTNVLPDLEAPKNDKFDGTFEDLLKMYEQDTNSKVLMLKTKKDGGTAKGGLERVSYCVMSGIRHRGQHSKKSG